MRQSSGSGREKPRSGRRVDGWLVRGSALATFLAVVLAVYFGLSARPRKELQLRYTAKLSLVSAEAISPENVVVSYQDRPVANLAKLSARLVNTGDVLYWFTVNWTNPVWI